jgi:hypothetical protein
LNSRSINSQERSEAKRAVVQDTETRILEMVRRLSRNCPAESLAETARKDLVALKPQLEGALVALEETQRRRSLTDKERSKQYTFKMLLGCSG